ncbi:hypothetical protein STENM223S_08518 [Streptomyces tendae]
MTNMKPLKPIENGTTSERPRRSDTIANRLGGTRGVRPARSARRSTAKNAAAANGNAASDSHVHSGQPAARPSVSGTSRVRIEAASRKVPGTSTGSGRAERVSGTARAARNRPARTTGTFTRKTERQPVPAMSAATRTPPRI